MLLRGRQRRNKRKQITDNIHVYMGDEEVPRIQKIWKPVKTLKFDLYMYVL